MPPTRDQAASSHDPSRWILVADMRSARLLHRRRPSEDGRHFEEVARLENHLFKHDRGGRPPASGARGIDYGNADRDHDVMRDQFAVEIVRWVEQCAGERRFSRVDVFVNPEMLGALRSVWPSHLAFEHHEHHADLIRLSPAELEHHQAIRQLDALAAT